MRTSLYENDLVYDAYEHRTARVIEITCPWAAVVESLRCDDQGDDAPAWSLPDAIFATVSATTN